MTDVITAEKERLEKEKAEKELRDKERKEAKENLIKEKERELKELKEGKDKEPVYVVNKSDQPISEYKPEIGNFTVPANGRLEIRDALKDFKTPDGRNVPYVYAAAKDIAESIVRDYGKPDVLYVEDAGPKDETKETKEEKKEDKSLFSKDKK